MNEPITETITETAAECCTAIDQRIRNNPGTTMLIAVGAGLAIALIVRALRPEPTARQRLAQMLDDLQHRVREAAAPALHKAGELASEGAEAVRDGWHSGEAGVGRLFRAGTGRLRQLFRRG